GYYPGRGYLGDTAEVAVYNRVLSRAEVYQVEQYLSSRYNISLTAQGGAPIAGLRGSDLTDVGDNGNKAAYVSGVNRAGFDADFFGNNKANFGATEAAFNVFDNVVGNPGGNQKWCCDSADVPGGLFVGADFRNTLPSGKAIVLTSFTLSSDN